jgi:hypothetical protein
MGSTLTALREKAPLFPLRGAAIGAEQQLRTTHLILLPYALG